MSDFQTARVYAAEKVGPINVGAGANDYICKIFARTPEGHHVVVTVTPANYEGHVKALLDGHPALVICDPSKVISMQIIDLSSKEAIEDAIKTTRDKTLKGRQQEPDRRQPGT